MPPVQEIFITNDARLTFRTVLGGQSVRFRFWWQPSDGHWYMSMAFTTGVKIVSGVRLVETADLLAGLVLDFKGRIAVGGPGSPGRNSWGETHRLFYIS